MGDDKVEYENWEVQPNVVVTEQYVEGRSRASVLGDSGKDH